MPAPLRDLVLQARSRLGVRRLLLGVHDAAFPSRPEEDVGRGSPHADGASDLLELVHGLGFDGLQLGPQGATSAANASPYDGAFFSRAPLSVGLASLSREEWGALLPRARLEEAVAAARADPGRVDHPAAFHRVTGLLAEVASSYRERAGRGEGGELRRVAAELASFREAQADWLERDALHEELRREKGAPLGDAPSWAEVAADRTRYRSGREDALQAYALVQLVLATQHRALREKARALGLLLFGDLQVGMSERDAWAARAFTLDGWRMGAPPSRTNPAGQAWNYPVLDPRLYRVAGGADGPALAFFRARLRRAFQDYDGLRIDHPHGLVCPWVYPVDADPDRAVRERGARLFESPDLPALAPFAIARPDQIDGRLPRFADGWVRELDGPQVERLAVLLDVVMEEAALKGAAGIAAEVLSTLPLPLRRVIERHGLGRFRVTQKASLERRDDVYRAENARPEDWIQLGTHDTPTIWGAAAEWVASGEARDRADHLAWRLRIDVGREAWIARVASDRGALVQAQLADLFVGPAGNAVVYFTDLFGSEEPYNRPGTVGPGNWAQRVPREPVASYRSLLARGRALDVAGALGQALRTRGLGDDGLPAALEAGRWGEGGPEKKRPRGP
jgi:4-alpha-glucanotransferase